METNMLIKLGDKHQVQAKKKGAIRLGDVEIEAFFIPEFRISHLSVGQLDSHGYTSTFKSGICSIANSKGSKVLSAVLEQGLYVISTDGSAHDSEIRLLRTKSATTLETWHKRFAHLNYQDLKHLLNRTYKWQTDATEAQSVTDATEAQSVTDATKAQSVTDAMNVELDERASRTNEEHSKDPVEKRTD